MKTDARIHRQIARSRVKSAKKVVVIFRSEMELNVSDHAVGRIFVA